MFGRERLWKIMATNKRRRGRGDRRRRQNEEETRETDGIVAVTASSSQ